MSDPYTAPVFLGQSIDSHGNATAMFTPNNGAKTLISSGHYGYPRFPPNRDVGGGFQLYGVHIDWGFSLVGEIAASGGGYPYYKGMVCAKAASSGLTPIIDNGASSGGEAYRRMKPTKPSFKALNAIYELRDLPGMLKQRMHSNGLHNIGSYYLAYKFGWAALVNDIKKLIQTQQRMEKRVNYLLKHNGKPTRRRCIVSSSSDGGTLLGTSDTYQETHPGFTTGYYNGYQHSVRRLFLEDDIWASAQFRFWLPPGPKDIQYRRRLIAELYGLYPSPSVIWNAMPWTWLTDWFFDVGTLLENCESGIDSRLAADWFYVMRHHRRRVQNDVTGTYYGRNGSPVNFQSTTNWSRFCKSRVPGDRFGIPLLQNQLDSGQLAILGALGLSRL